MKKEKNERFVRLAVARTNKIIKMLRLLSNLSNKSIYDYSDDEVKRIFRAIEQELRTARSRFSEKSDDHFTLS